MESESTAIAPMAETFQRAKVRNPLGSLPVNRLSPKPNRKRAGRRLSGRSASDVHVDAELISTTEPPETPDVFSPDIHKPGLRAKRTHRSGSEWANHAANRVLRDVIKKDVLLFEDEPGVGNLCVPARSSSGQPASVESSPQDPAKSAGKKRRGVDNSGAQPPRLKKAKPATDVSIQSTSADAKLMQDAEQKTAPVQVDTAAAAAQEYLRKYHEAIALREREIEAYLARNMVGGCDEPCCADRNKNDSDLRWGRSILAALAKRTQVQRAERKADPAQSLPKPMPKAEAKNQTRKNLRPRRSRRIASKSRRP